MASPRKFLILAKIETTQFTDPVPTPAANSILVKNLRVTPLRVESEDRALIRPYFGNSEQLPVMEEAMIEFDVEVAGSSALGTAPKWGPLVRATGFAEVISAGVSVTYNPVSAAFEYLTIYAYRDGLLYKMTGCHGSVSMDFAAKRIPHMHYRFVGKYVAVSDAAIPAGSDFSAFQTPKASIPTWTGTLTVDAFAAKVAALSVDMQSEVSHAIWMNAETIQPVDRKPRGSITVEQVTVATYNYFTKITGANLVALALTHGTVATNRVKVTAPKMQLVDIEEADFEGTSAHRLNVTFAPNTGNDEVAIEVT